MNSFSFSRFYNNLDQILEMMISEFETTRLHNIPKEILVPQGWLILVMVSQEGPQLRMENA